MALEFRFQGRGAGFACDFIISWGPSWLRWLGGIAVYKWGNCDVLLGYNSQNPWSLNMLDGGDGSCSPKISRVPLVPCPYSIATSIEWPLIGWLKQWTKENTHLQAHKEANLGIMALNRNTLHRLWWFVFLLSLLPRCQQGLSSPFSGLFFCKMGSPSNKGHLQMLDCPWTHEQPIPSSLQRWKDFSVLFWSMMVVFHVFWKPETTIAAFSQQ